MQRMEVMQQTMQMMFQEQSDDIMIYVMELNEGSNVNTIGYCWIDAMFL